MINLLLLVYKHIILFKKKKYIDTLIKHGLTLGKKVSIVDTFFFDPSHCYLISIGDNCTICPNVRLIAHDASTRQFLGYTKFGKITIKENCFIGDSTIILPNVEIGPNTIIGAGSIVTSSIPPNTVAAGIPARPISSLDDYLHKVKRLSEKEKIFGKEYYIEKLDERSRQELIDAADKKVGFIL